MRSAWLKGFRDGWQLEIVATKLDVGLLEKEYYSNALA